MRSKLVLENKDSIKIFFLLEIQVCAFAYSPLDATNLYISKKEFLVDIIWLCNEPPDSLFLSPVEELK